MKATLTSCAMWYWKRARGVLLVLVAAEARSRPLAAPSSTARAAARLPPRRCALSAFLYVLQPASATA